MSRLNDLSQAPRPLFDPTQPGGSRTFRGAAGFVDSNGRDRNMQAPGSGGMPQERQAVSGPSQLTQPNVGPSTLADMGGVPPQAGPPPQGQPQMTLANLGQPPQGPQQPQQAPQGDTVLMQAPDGSKMPVPRDKVALAIQKGCQVIG